MLHLTFEQKIKLYDTIIWGGVIYIALWVILKMAERLNTEFRLRLEGKTNS